MKISVVASTKEGHVLSREDALRLGSKFAGICYSEKDFDGLSSDTEEDVGKRMNLTLDNGHHSVYGHPVYSLYLVGLPKILAMVLNNEKVYTTSEKSARFTQMQPSPEEKALYDQWLGVFRAEIKKRYPSIKADKRKKLAQENARYLTSVFTPTRMAHSIDFRQLNYVMHMFDTFRETAEDTPFNLRLKASMAEFNSQLGSLYVDKLDPAVKYRSLSLFSARKNQGEFFDEAYSTNYEMSFAGLAQAHRHRTINYGIVEITGRFFVPPIIQHNHALVQQWLKDLDAVGDNFPQATLLGVNERGIYEDFISKACERLCGQAQLEIMQVTRNTLEMYVAATATKNPEVHKAILPYASGPRCTFPDYKCASPCPFGKKGLERLI